MKRIFKWAIPNLLALSIPYLIFIRHVEGFEGVLKFLVWMHLIMHGVVLGMLITIDEFDPDTDLVKLAEKQAHGRFEAIASVYYDVLFSLVLAWHGWVFYAVLYMLGGIVAYIKTLAARAVVDGARLASSHDDDGKGNHG